MLQVYISNGNQHIKRSDKQKLISAAILLGNAARLNGLNAGEKYDYSKEGRGVYLFFFFPCTTLT